MSLVEVSGLTMRYGWQYVLENLSFQIEPGRIVGLLGPNGCGKTTTMKILAGLLPGYGGQVRIDGHAPDQYTRSVISYLPEKTYLTDSSRPVDALRIFSDFYADFDRRRAESILMQMQIDLRQPVRLMSKGMQEKLQLALVMSRRAKLYILDEPLGGVDPAARRVILDAILQNYTEQSSILLSTQLIQDVERIFDDVLLMGSGKIVLSGHADEIRAARGQSLNQVFEEVFACAETCAEI
ncbi:MAG TPA: ABC transporter ATP-binding protein [Firmicutes bacterium]|nr:ABC transporter ATP-binding protein [Bacillota bacterium]